MSHCPRSLWLMLPALLVFVLSGSVIVAKDAVPIQGTVKGTVGVTPLDGAGSHFRLDNVGRGTCSHLGRVETIWAVPDVELDLVARTVTVADPEWGGTLRAANGDEIVGRYTFTQNPIPFAENGDIVFETDLVLTSGTGRFEGATGNAHTTGRANIFTMTFEIDLVGEISTVGP